MCEGEFTPAPRPRVCRRRATAPPGQAGGVTVRFPDSTGLPNIPDGPRAGPQGMAVKFHLPDGSTDIVSNAFNGFAVATAEEFLAFLRAVSGTRPDAPKPTPLKKFLG